MEDMLDDEVQRLVARSRFAELGLAKDGQAYVVPLFYGYDGRSFYFHSHPGMKDDFIESTEEACLVVVHVESSDAWMSVMAFGPIEPVSGDAQLRAMDALLALPLPPEFGFSEMGEPRRSAKDMRLWKLTPTRITGRKSVTPPASLEEVGVTGG